MKSDFEQLRGRDPHEVLGVRNGADRQQLIRAFRRRARHGGHPDTGGDAQTFEELTRARDILLDSHRLAAYQDRQRAAHASRRPSYSTARPVYEPASAPAPGVRRTGAGAAPPAEGGVRMSPQQGYPRATGNRSSQRPGGSIFPVVLIFFFLFVAPMLVRMLVLLFVGG